MKKLAMLAGAAVGYVFGTRAGRERYEQIKDGASRLWKNPQVQNKISDAEHAVADAAKKGVDAAGAKISDIRHKPDASDDPDARDESQPS